MDEYLKAHHKTLKSAAESGTTAHIGPKECQQAADAIQRTVDEAFDKDAQRNAAENEKPVATAAGFRIPAQSKRRIEDTVL